MKITILQYLHKLA